MDAETLERPAKPAHHSGVSLAGVFFRREDNIDALLSRVAVDLGTHGLRVAGLVQEEAPRTDGSCCPATFVRDLSDNTRTKISADRGAGARGCRLDPAALTEAAKRVDNALLGGAQVLLVNRFGQSESEGRGLRATIELAIELGIPVVVGVREPYVEAWNAFHCGLAAELPLDGSAIYRWLTAERRNLRTS